MPAPTGYTRGQIRRHWIIAALIELQYLFKVALVGLPVAGALRKQFVLRTGILSRMSRAGS